MADPIRERIFALAAQHSDQTICNRERALQGWNFSKDGLLAFVRAARELEATPEEADRAQWEGHIRMERQAHAERDPNAQTGDDADGVTAGAPGETDAERAAWLADKIGALGDYAKEAAAMLRRWPAGVRVGCPRHGRVGRVQGCSDCFRLNPDPHPNAHGVQGTSEHPAADALRWAGFGPEDNAAAGLGGNDVR